MSRPTGSPARGAGVRRSGARCENLRPASRRLLPPLPDADQRRQLAAGALSLPSGVEAALAGDDDPEVRFALAHRADCSLRLLARLAADPAAGVRGAAASNPRCRNSFYASSRQTTTR